MKSFEFTGKTIEKAIKLGLETLNKTQDEVDIQILSEGGLFKKAKVVIKFEDQEVKNFKENVEEPKIEAKTEEKQEQPKPAKEEKAEVERVVEEPKKEEVVENKTEKVEEENKSAEIKSVSDKDHIKQEKKAVFEKKRNNDYVIPTQEELEEKRRKFAETHFENNQTSVEFIEGLLPLLKIDGKVMLEEKKDDSYILIETEDAGRVIGYKGDSLAGIQYLANIIESNKNPNAKRVVIDSGNYRQKREESLRNLAIRIAGKVSETGRAQRLEPMDAFERRIVHTELQNYPSVETHSEGVEPFRRIVITKKKN